jgi:hypothetical protein
MQETGHYEIIHQSAIHALESAVYYLLTNGQPKNKAILNEAFKDLCYLTKRYYNNHAGKGTNPDLVNFIKDIHEIHKKHYPIHDWDNFETLRLWNAVNYQINNSRILLAECVELHHHTI